MMRRIVVCSFVALAAGGCWYTATEENHRYGRPEWLGFKQASRLSDDEQRRIDALVADGRFDEVERYFVADAARRAAEKGNFAAAFADDARSDAREARAAAKQWQNHQRHLKDYRKDCGIPEPLPLPKYCGTPPNADE